MIEVIDVEVQMVSNFSISEIIPASLIKTVALYFLVTGSTRMIKRKSTLDLVIMFISLFMVNAHPFTVLNST